MFSRPTGMPIIQVWCKVARTRPSKPLRQKAVELRSYVLSHRRVYVHITGLVRAKDTTVTLTMVLQLTGTEYSPSRHNAQGELEMPVRAFTEVFLVDTARRFALITLRSERVVHIRAMTHAARKATNTAKTVERDGR